MRAAKTRTGITKEYDVAVRELLFLVIGIPFGVAANAAYHYVRIVTGRTFDRIQLEGKWGEYVENYSDHQYSIGEIRYDLRRRMWAFNGTNYYNDGRPYCHWETLASYFDKTKREFYYTFHNTLLKSSQTSHVGFGVIRFRREEGKWIPDRGFFISGSEGESYLWHTMVPLDRIPVGREEVRAVLTSNLGLTDQ